jgi:hypothetical protein
MFFSFDYGSQELTGSIAVIAVAKNNVPLAIRDREFGRPTVTAVFSVIPAKAGIQILDPGPSPG